MSRTPAALVVTIAALAALTAPGQAQQRPQLDSLKTVAESSDYRSTSTYAEVLGFMNIVADASPLIHLTSYGTTYEGRMMPLAVVGTGLADGSAAAVKASGKLRVHIQGNIHAGEVEGKEATLVLLREFARGQHADWLDSMVFLITPIFNADGNERFALNNRPRQNGPINGMGTRANGQGLNINRDFMKLDTPEARAFAKLWTEYDPYVGMDLHTSDGSAHAYHLTYSPPLNPNTSGAIMQIMKDEWFPYVTKAIRDKHGWETFYYGNAGGGPGVGRGGRGGGRGGRGAGRGGATGSAVTPPPAPPAPTGPPAPRTWGTFEHVPRFHNNYVGLRNRFALLSEAYAYATFEDRIKATNYFIEEAMNFAHQNVAKIKQAVADADQETITGQTQATRAQKSSGGLIEILMGEVENETNPLNGAVMNRRTDALTREQMTDGLWFEPTSTEVAPATYYLPASAVKTRDLLLLHGVEIHQTTEPITDVEQFAITANTTRSLGTNIDFLGHAMRTLDGAWAPAPDATVPAGSWVVRMDQALARLAFYLLEPTSDDGAVTWNYLDNVLATEGVTTYPILRKR